MRRMLLLGFSFLCQLVAARIVGAIFKGLPTVGR
jgi:hypothetical protein